MGQTFTLRQITTIYYLIIHQTCHKISSAESRHGSIYNGYCFVSSMSQPFLRQERPKFDAMPYSREKVFHVNLLGIAWFEMNKH